MDAYTEWQQARAAARDAANRYGQALEYVRRIRQQRERATDLETIRTLTEQLEVAEREQADLALLEQRTRRAGEEAEARVTAERRSLPDRAAKVARLQQQLTTAKQNAYLSQLKVDSARADLAQAERQLAHARQEHEALAAQLAVLVGESEAQAA